MGAMSRRRNEVDDLLTPTEVATWLRVPRDTVYSWRRRGKLPGAKIGRHIRFRRGDVERVLREQLDAAA